MNIEERLTKFANGGIVTQDTQSIIEKSGIETILPLTDGKDIKIIADGIMNQYKQTGNNPFDI